MVSVRLGAVIGSVFGLIFVLVNTGSLPAVVAVPLRSLGVVAFIIVLITAMITRRRVLPVAGERSATRGFTPAYWLVVAAEVVALVAGMVVLEGPLHAPQAAVAWIALVVGIHYLPLAAIWKLPFLRGLGAVLMLCGLTGLALAAASAAASTIDLVAGVLPGAALLGSGLWGSTRRVASTVPASAP